jgi:superfamily II DNA or RNA helicase
LNLALRSPAVIAEMAREIVAKADPQAVVFCCSKQHCVDLAAALNALRPNSAAAIYDNCADRDEIWYRFKRGTLLYLCNINILIEGIDVPNINTVAFARLTQSAKTYLQMLGRGVRRVEGRDTFLVLDFAGTSKRNQALTLQDVLDHLDGDIILDIPKKRELKPKGKARKVAQGIRDLRIPAQVVDQFRMVEDADELICFLSGQGVPRETIVRRGPQWCLKMREEILERERNGLCTWRQAKMLERFGLDGRHCPKKTAGAIAGYISKLGYKGRWPMPTAQIISQVQRAWPRYRRD